MRRGLLALAVALAGPALLAQAQVAVVSRQPARHAVAARTAAVAIGFSQPIAAATAANLRVYGALLQGKRAGSVAGGGTATLTFTPAQAFAPGEAVSVSVPATLASPAGSAVARQVYQFTAATGGPGRGFFLDTTYVGYTTSRDQVLGDLDNDGDLDLLTTGGLYGGLVYLNDGAGKYTFKTGFPAAEVPAGLALTDVNQDGYLDVLMGDSKNNTVAVRINDGTGDFYNALLGYQNAPVGAGPTSVASGDVDGDGDLDFVTANLTGGTSTVWVNTGYNPLNPYYFTSTTTLGMGASPTAVALADIDNDGDLDLLTTNAGTASSPQGEVHISRNNGTGSFGAYTVVAVGLRPSELALADLDGDGDLDLLTANAGAASVSVRTNNGSGGFSGTTTLALAAGSTPSGLRTGDVDADGDLDVVVAQGTGGRVLTYLNTGGMLAAQGRQLRLSGLGAPAAAVGVALGDVDGDLDLDLITSDYSGNVLLGRNNGVPAPLPPPVITGVAPAAGPVGSSVTLTGTALVAVTAVAFNGTAAPGFVPDGLGTAVRVAVPPGASSGPITVTTEDAGAATSPGPFTVTVPVPVLLTGISPARNAASVPAGSPVAATFAAAITTATAGGLRVFGSQRRGRRPGTLVGAGTATLRFDPDQDFAPGEQLSVSLPNSLRAADGNQVRPQVVQFTAAVGGTGQADFTTATTLAVTQASQPAVGDVDNDGDLDLVVPGRFSGVVSVRLNDGAGQFSTAPDVATGAGIRSVQLADVDADGDLDLVLCYTSGAVNLWLNRGNGTFASGGTVGAVTYVTQVALGDVDADGDLDMVLLASQNIRVQLNDGAGNFADSYGFYLASGAAPASLALGDVDNDGDLDLLAAGDVQRGQYAVSTQLNDGTGRFGAGAVLVLPNATAVSGIALGDLDGDGDLDLVVQNILNAATRASVRLNDGTGTFSGLGDLPLGGAGPLLADVDADGDLDIITHLGVGLNNGAAGFTTLLPTASTAAYPGGIALGDLDGDGDLDLLTTEENNVVSIRRNQPRPRPTLTALVPASGPVGARVLLTGTSFVGAKGVAFNGVPASTYTVRSATELAVTVPAGATSGPVTVTTAAGVGTSAASFAVTQPVAVTAISPARHAASAPRGSAVAVTFAQPISSASAGGLRVAGALLGGARGTLAGGGTAALTVTPGRAFAPGEAVRVTIPASLTSTTGGSVPRQVYQFTAAAGGTGTGLFMALGTADVPLAYRAIDLTVGDVDNDGDVDLVTTDGSVRLNDGTGAFSASPTGVALGGDPWGIALGDLNGDGAPDVVTTNGQVRLNTGTGTFSNLPDFTYPSSNVRSIALGDLDGDGDLDVVTPNYATDSVYVRFNDGTGRFPTKQLLAVGNRPVSVALGDVDNDGDLDVLAASEGFGSEASTLSICFNSGPGVFERVGTLAAGSYVKRFALGDLDADGDLDLVLSTGLVRFNDGTGTFAGTQTTSSNQGLALGDVDADGDLDLVTTGSLAAAVCLNDGRGTFGPGTSFDFGSNWGNLSLADIDADGDLDALASGASNRVVHLRLNQRVAPPAISSFSPTSGLPGATVVVAGTDLVGITSVRFNGTLAPDFTLSSAMQLTVKVPAGATTGPLSVANPRGTASSAQAFTVLLPVPVLSTSPARNAVVPPATPVVVRFGQALPANSPASLAVFSAQRGGLLAGTRQGAGTSTLTFTPAQPFQPGEQLRVSLPAYTDANRARVLRQVYQFWAAVGGTGRGFFAEPTTFARSTTSAAPLLLGDVDNDGDQDVLTGSYSAVQVQRNNGAGTFSAATSVAVANNPGSLALGDIDGDGDLDLAAASWSGTTVSIRFNDGTGTFSGTQEVVVGDGPQSVALADMDADGDLDLVTLNDGAYTVATPLVTPANTTSVRFNDGTGTFSGLDNVVVNTQTHYGTSNLEVGDLDGDGDLDLVVGATGSLYVRLNDGTGQLAATPALDLPYGASTIRLSDIDGDGDLDLLAIGSSSIGGTLSPVSVLRNAGNATFTATTFPTSPNASNLVVGDVDADGDPDLLVANSDPSPGQLWLNDGKGTFAQLLDVPLGNLAGQLLLSDVDNDGDLDLLNTNVTFAGALTYSVRLNGPTPPPVVASFSPTSGPAGTVVMVAGSGFLGTTAVRFNGTLAPGFVINSPTQLTVKVPEGATTGPLSVTTPIATAASPLAFTVIPLVRATTLAPRPNAVAVAPSAALTLGFAAPITAATAGSLRVFGNQLRGRRPGTLAGGGTATLSFAPDQSFAPGEQLSVSLPATMRTTTGGQVRPLVYQFTAATGGTGRGLFRAGATLRVGWYATDLVVGDLDNDGDLDMLTPIEAQYTGANTIAVQRNDGQGHFVAGASFDPGSYSTPTHLLLGDVDADGDLDAVASFGGAALSVSLNNGTGTFAAAQKFYNLPCDNLVLGDVDADGDLDVVMTSYQSSQLRVALNNGAGSFALQPLAVAAPQALAVTLGDVDNDGDLDALTTSAGFLRLYLNDGTGAFAASLALPLPDELRAAALADLDADGDLDVAVSSNDASSAAWLTVLRNDGSGSFTASGPRVALGQYTNRLLLGDVDHDADLDVLATNGSSNDVAVRLNNGQGQFFGTPNVAVSANPNALALGDFDGDGDLDFAALQAATGGALLNVLLNDGLALATAPASPGTPGLALYPNPAHGQFVVVVPAALRPLAAPAAAPLRLYNALGQLVVEQPLQLSGAGEVLVSVAHLPAGLYTLRLPLRDGLATYKVTLE